LKYLGLFFILFSFSGARACLSTGEVENEVSAFQTAEAPVIAQLPLPVRFHYSSSAATITAFAFQADGVIHIEVVGSHCLNLIGVDELKLLMCHELGHYAGGAPYETSGEVPARSSEGQADYYATSRCLLPFVANDPSRVLHAALNLATYVHPAFATATRPNLDSGLIPSLGARAPEVVDETLYNSYPTAQCRLDTFVAGLHGDARPACWFHDAK